jgi:hypothetical protein
LIFKIFLSRETTLAPSNIELSGKDFSFYPSEQEVLLLPFFTFRVIDIVETKEKPCECKPVTDKIVNAKVTVVTVMEVPYQNTLNQRVH